MFGLGCMTGMSAVWAKNCKTLLLLGRLGTYYCTNAPHRSQIIVNGHDYITDDWTNITTKIQSKIGRNLHNVHYHPINLIRQRIQHFFYKTYVNRVGNPLYTVVDNLNPVVTTHQNFDSLLVPVDHVSRSPKDSYYINKNFMLRAHTSAHQEDLIKSGLNKFLVVGDVYRRDSIDSSHYPVFHQMEGVCLFTSDELFANQTEAEDLQLFEDTEIHYADKQGCHTYETSLLVENHLKKTLLDLTFSLLGKDLEYKWVDCSFPFTHPSWELEIKYEGDWLEVLGCGVMKQEILNNAGASNQVGWAFGLGLDRLAMRLYGIPSIRLFWSEDERFLRQFKVDNPYTPITFKPFSNQPPTLNDISFWIPTSYDSNDFYDLVRSVGGELVEEVQLIDEFTHPKSSKMSHCYRISYRHTDRALSQEEVNMIHSEIERQAADKLCVEVR